MRLLLSIVMASCLLSASVDSAEISKDDVSRAIDIDSLEHPYFFLLKKDLPAVRKRVEDDPECRDIYQRMSAEANRYLYTPVENFKPGEETDFYAGRLAYLRAQRRAAETLAFVYLVSGEKKYADKAYQFADSICGVSDWVNGYHQFPVIYTRVWPWNVPDDQVNFSVDLEASHTAYSLALVYDWIYNALEKPQRDRIRGALLEKIITRVRGSYEYFWWASAYRCNWCTVCSSALGLSVLALLKEEPNLTDVIAESYNRISRTLDEVGVDGGWQEGCSYWNYMELTAIEFADVMKQVSGGKCNLFEHPALRNNPVSFAVYTHIPPANSVNFGDASNSLIGQTYFFNKLAAETGSREAAWYRNNRLGTGNSMYDILWPKNDVMGELPKTLSRHFRTIDWAVLRNSIDDPEDVVIAVKAGLHNDPHHGHLDCGNFILYWRGEGFISEMGRGAYDERYFQETRWEFPAASAEGHNVVIVNGEGQIPEKHKDEPWQDGIGGKILRFDTGHDLDYVLLDAGGAYPGKELKSWRRHILLVKPQMAVILDEVGADPGSEIAIRYHSEAKQVPNGRYMTLDGVKGDMALFPVCEYGFRFRQDRHPVMSAQGLTLNRAQFRWEPFCDIVVEAKQNKTVVAAVVLPAESSEESDTVAESLEFKSSGNGGYSLSFDYRGKEYNYRFKRGDGGLVYER